MCGKNKVKLTRNQSISFYGCQVCYQSRKFMERPTQIIVEATDEEVELFAVQVGNELNRNPRSQYKKMKCTVQPTCRLMENTLRILDKIFGGVEWRS